MVMGAGIFAIAWAVRNPNANTAARVIVAVLGEVAQQPGPLSVSIGGSVVETVRLLPSSNPGVALLRLMWAGTQNVTKDLSDACYATADGSD
jgi:hypothetical protein